MTELWLPVPGYEGLYEISIYGRVRRLYRHHTRVLTPDVTRRGYHRVHLHGRDHRRHHHRVHRLVAAVFLGPAPTPTHQVNHRSGVKADNSIANLEWLTPEENRRHARLNGLVPRHWGTACRA